MYTYKRYRAKRFTRNLYNAYFKPQHEKHSPKPIVTIARLILTTLPAQSTRRYNVSMLTKKNLEDDLKDAMRARDDVRKRTLRMVLTAVKLQEVERKGELDEPSLLAIVQKEVKTRLESIEEAERIGREDLVSATKAEVDVLQEYLPQALTEEELTHLVRQTILQVEATSPADMGQVMKALMPQVRGRADGKVANDIVKRLLSEL